jgi:tripartite-type tricarboxylate transporter receptor subunit TctC
MHLLPSARALCSILTAAICAVSSHVVAETYPSRHVSVIIQTAPGSGPDVIARIVAERLARQWSQQVIVLNRNGAAGVVAAQAAAGAQPDGYTLYMPTSTALVILPVTRPKMPVNFERDFVPIGLISESPMIIAVSPALGVNTIEEFIALAKQRPGQLLYAANNRGSFPHLAGEFFRSRAGIDLTFVPYAGAAAGLQDVLGGRISTIIEGPAALGGAIRDGSLKALAVTSATRLREFPGVPTVAETIPNFQIVAWFALMARAGTPDEIVHKVSGDLRAILEERTVTEKFATLGVYPRPTSPAETAEFIRREQQAWRPIIKDAGLEAQ